MALCDRRILIVEDEYMLAYDIKHELEDAGAIVVGPEPSVARALTRIADEALIDGAILDVNLGDDLVFPVADALVDRHVPFLFASGYGENAVATRYPGVMNYSKPLDMRGILRALDEMLREP